MNDQATRERVKQRFLTAMKKMASDPRCHKDLERRRREGQEPRAFAMEGAACCPFHDEEAEIVKQMLIDGEFDQELAGILGYV